MKRYTIALAGTFDVENYGDLMFPVIFERAMLKRGLNFETVLFSPSDKAPEALNKDRTVYSYKNFEELNSKYHFDALVIGGGALIHFRNFKIFMPNQLERTLYYNIHSWLSLIYLAARNNIKILFNLPQVPFDIPIELRSLAKMAFEQVDYFTVRDATSKEYIESIYGKDEKRPKIEVFPDTVCIVNELFNADSLLEKKRKLLGFDDKYMVFHFQYVEKVSESLFLELEKVVEDAIGRGLKVVLLPIGYTHGDQEIMTDFNRRCGNKCVMLKKKLDIEDMTAILMGCEYYIGMSFHGGVVSLSFDKRAFSTNPSLKNKELYGSYGLGECLQESYDGILNILDKAKIDEENHVLIKRKISKSVNTHFDNIYNHIVESKISKKTPELLIGEVFNAISMLESTNREQGALLAECRERFDGAEQEVRDLKKDIDLIRNSTAFKIGSSLTWLPHKITKRKK